MVPHMPSGANTISDCHMALSLLMASLKNSCASKGFEAEIDISPTSCLCSVPEREAENCFLPVMT